MTGIQTDLINNTHQQALTLHCRGLLCKQPYVDDEEEIARREIIEKHRQHDRYDHKLARDFGISPDVDASVLYCGYCDGIALNI